MNCLDSFLFRCWQMGWLKQYDDTCTETRIENQLGLMIDVMRNMAKSVSNICNDFSSIIDKTGPYSDKKCLQVENTFPPNCSFR